MIIIMVSVSACVTRKKKGEISKAGKFYQNTTSYYNGYWNAKELMRESLISLRAANVDNYSEILEVEDYVSLDNPKMAKADMDKIIEKVSTVAQLREASDWVDDCYVMMARAQYTKQEYETAEETLEYFEEDFNPGNPYGRNYKSKKLRGKAAKRMKEIQRKEKEKERKDKAEEREKVAEEKAKSAKEKNEERKKAAKAKAKERERAAKARKKNKGKSDRKIEVKTAPQPQQTTTAPKKDPAIEKKAEDEEITPPVKVAPQEDKTAFSEGRLWLAKTYIKRQNYSGAESILNRLTEIITNEDVTREIPAIQASLYIKKKEYDKALISLAKAIDLADDKQNKARYSFIAGQIYQRQGQYAEAYAFFDKAAKLSKDIKMEFVADLESLKTGILSGQSSKDKTVAQLTKRIDEVKYADYKDQLYFTIGEIEKSQNNFDAAIDAYKKAISVANSNIGKVDAYYNIAEINLNQEKYLEAWKYYDSTSSIITKTDFRAEKVQNYALNLKDIAAQIEIINQQDTLLAIAALEGNDQKKAAKKYFLLYQKRQEKSTNTQPKSNTFFNSIQKSDNSGSNFFAYNEAVKKKGKEDFIKIWGDRPLADDWRRSAAASNSLAGGDSDPNSSDLDKQAPSKSAEELENEKLENNEEYKKFLRDLPTNPVKKQEVNDKIMNAQFVLGKLFRDKIQKFDKSAATLESMHAKYGATPFELESSYYLYLDYLELNDNVNAAKYKNKILDRYGDSKYASILRNPEAYAKSNNVDKPDQYYNQVYKLFNDGKYQDALVNIDKATTSLESSNPYKAKFALLRAMCLGSTQGKDAYVQGLMGLITSFPNTPEELKAKEILRFLGGDKAAFSTIGVQDVDKIYEKSDDEKHYVAVVTYQLKEEDLVATKIAISDYNKANFKLERLQMGDGILNIEDNSQIILIRSFDNSVKVMDFYKKVSNDKEAFLGPNNINVDILPISTRNYRKMLSERNANGYRVFFEKNYLNK